MLRKVPATLSTSSKFQTLLPPEFQRELLACELLNRDDTRQWLQEWLAAGCCLSKPGCDRQS